jgi:hypothetical protein
MPLIATITARFQSYNIEMVEVTGGYFWKPYRPDAAARIGNADAPPPPPGVDRSLYAYRKPIDLAHPRLRRLAAALAPSYVRVSGTWANATWFALSEEAPSAPPPGFNGVLTRAQWRGVVDFARRVDAPIVTSLAISAGTRDAAGVWKPDQAQSLIAYTRELGAEIAAAELVNEPNVAIGGIPKGYDALAYGRDFKAFRAFARKAAPRMLILGPGSVGERGDTANDVPDASRTSLTTRNLLAASGPGVDAFSYHHYGAASRRCAGTGMEQTTPDAALSAEWLARTERTLAFYRGLRDRFEPGRPLWLTETADAVCGGNPWASTFLDTFRYLDQLGRLARAGVSVVMHNTLAASDYGLLDESSFAPRPNYWGALLWRRLMGTTVLDAGAHRDGLHVYAHCRRGVEGDVALMVINTDRSAARTLQLPVSGERYTLAADALQSAEVRLNGELLRFGADDVLPRLAGTPTAAGPVAFAPATITFLTVAAGNGAC